MDEAVRTAWLTGWRAMQRYHRFSVRGIEVLDSPRSLLLVAYHGRPIAHDQCMLSVSAFDRLGYLPRGVVHKAAFHNPVSRGVVRALGFVAGDGPEIEAALAAGQHVAVQPGGTREGCRSVRHRYRVDWGDRTGFVRLALKYRLPVVPIASHGVDDAWIGLNDGDRWGRRLGLPAGLPLWVGVGLGGVWPFGMPLPVRVTTYLGQPIDLQDRGPVDPSDPDALIAAQRRVARAVQALLP